MLAYYLLTLLAFGLMLAIALGGYAYIVFTDPRRLEKGAARRDAKPFAYGPQTVSHAPFHPAE